jgi:hypothetical protein
MDIHRTHTLDEALFPLPAMVSCGIHRMRSEQGGGEPSMSRIHQARTAVQALSSA